MNLKLKYLGFAILCLLFINLLWRRRSGESGDFLSNNASDFVDVSSVFPFTQPAAIALLELDDASFEYMTGSEVRRLDSVGRFAVQRRANVVDSRLYARLDVPRLSQRRVIVTLLTNDAYVLAACVLAHSLRRVKTSVPIVALITGELAASGWAMSRLTRAGFDYVLLVDKIANPAHVALEAQRQQAEQLDASNDDNNKEKNEKNEKPVIKKSKADKMQAHKADVFTKLRVFSLTEYERVLYVDADCVVTRNIDHLLERDTPFAFAPSLQPLRKCEKPEMQKYVFRYKDADWCQSHSKSLYHGTIELYNHNAGVMLLEPRLSTFSALVQLMNDELNHEDSCIGQPGCNDQRVINVHYSDPSNEKSELELEYNIFCDQLITLGWDVQQFDPTVVHYRGGSKPWALDAFPQNSRTPHRHQQSSSAASAAAAAAHRNLYLLPQSTQLAWVESHHNTTLWKIKDQWFVVTIHFSIFTLLF